jgi:hypothetical protein
MAEETVIEPGAVVEAAEEAGEEAAVGGEPEGAANPEAAKAEAARWPELSSWLAGGSLWLYAVPVILLLVLWLFYPVILILVCIILLLWLLG